MYEVKRNGRTILEADACGIGFVASRRGWASRRLIEDALNLAGRFDHRGAPGHGAGMQLDIPWALLLKRFPKHASLIANREAAVGMFFLPAEARDRTDCTSRINRLCELAHSHVLAWEKVPVDESALPSDSPARRTLPYVAQVLLKRPDDLSEWGWFASRYLLRLAIEQEMRADYGDSFYVASLSNRTIVYKGLCELSRLADFYPDLRNPDYSSRYALFHSRYCTNTTTAWRRAQPFWSIAHNGEISTIKGNAAWMEAIGRDLLKRLAEETPELKALDSRVRSVICPGGSDTANLDDMVIALVAGGMSLSQAILGLLPEARSRMAAGSPLADFAQSMAMYLGACDGPAALVACDGDEAVAHLDRNGLRPLWFATTKEYAIAASELTGEAPFADLEDQRILGPGETVVVKLNSRQILVNGQVHEEVARQPFPSALARLEPAGAAAPSKPFACGEDLTRLQRAFGMDKEELSVIFGPLVEAGKPAIGAMGDDTPPSALLDAMPRRLEDYFKLRFAQETSPPIDPIRDAWVFDTQVMLGDRSGLWGGGCGKVAAMPHAVLNSLEMAWLAGRSQTVEISLLFPAREGEEGLERRLAAAAAEALDQAGQASVLILTDAGADPEWAAAPILRAASVIHTALVAANKRHLVGLVADAGVWDIHHAALLSAVGADAVHPWLGIATARSLGEGDQAEAKYIKGVRDGFVESMSMMGVTPVTAYCGARLVEAIGLDLDFLAEEFPGVPGHLGGIGREVLNREWLAFHSEAFGGGIQALPDTGEYRHSKDGRPHANNAEVVRSIQIASGYAKKNHSHPAGSYEAYCDYAGLVNTRPPVTVLDCLELAPAQPIPLEEVEPVEDIVWRFMAPGMSEGALSEPAHRAVARAMNLLHRWVRIRKRQAGLPLPPGIGPIANSGEGGFDKDRIGGRDGNGSIQYAGGRFTVTPMTASRAREAEVKFAQGAKPGKGGQLPGKKVSTRIARQRGCEPGYELVSPPINHNLYSIEDVKLMVESWRHLNPDVNCALKYVATYGVEMVVLGGVNAGANRLHISDGCGGTGAAKRVDQKHAGIPAAAALPKVQDMLFEEGVRSLVEVSVDGGVQTGLQALKLMLLGADRVGFGTSLLMAMGCAMLRKCHLAGPDPSDPTGKRRLGCAPGVATQDPVLVAKFQGSGVQVARYLLHAGREIRELMAAHGIPALSGVIGQRDLMRKRLDLVGKAALLEVADLVGAPFGRAFERDYASQTSAHMPALRSDEAEAAGEALMGFNPTLQRRLSNEDRCVGVRAAGVIARARGDLGLAADAGMTAPRQGSLLFEHEGAAGHFYAAYCVEGMEFRLTGAAADSCFTAAYGGRLVVTPPASERTLTLVGNTFGYGARGGRAYIAGRGGNRFGICLRKNHEGGGPEVVVEGVEANAFQYMTGGRALVLGPAGPNLGSGMTGGVVFLYCPEGAVEPGILNETYVADQPMSEQDEVLVRRMLEDHSAHTGSGMARCILEKFSPVLFRKVCTRLAPEPVE